MKHATTSATLGGSRTLMEYHCHTKVIAMDYTYKTIKYNLPLLNILSLTVRTVIQGFRFDKQVAHEQNIASKFRHVLGEITADTPALEGKIKEGHLEGEPFQQKGRLVRQKNDTQALFDFK
ncbi:hypothetical protein PPTG_22002 [Phytophthora nicotianae INRA-310]|uniref:Uncharacterized protein n=1 Tax=Phytophthora nicotianae (strain INRA-310) TaxID=761204 RepID=W2QU96_PHYN3|nr:hypothetical protein PPTG_22002 [Phytophthora nicotianae INRA-310]ETN15820.1 hypothetical protein PPTG_22002 [Phytophthora nicotianae INRA-310]